MSKPPFKFSARTRVGFSDTDAQGIVYYGRYNPYFDVARVEYLRSLGLLHAQGPGDFVMRANDVEYFAPAVFDDEIEVFVRVARVGRTSVTFAFAAYREPDETRRTHVPVLWHGDRVAELAVDDAPEEDRNFLEYVAVLVSGHCLVGWDTGGEIWEP